MTKTLRNKITVAAALLVLLAALFWLESRSFFTLRDDPARPEVLSVKQPGFQAEAAAKNTHKLIYFDQKTFWQGVSDTANKPLSDVPKNFHSAGGIIPHHLLPGGLLSDFFLRLERQDPKIIFLIGPNHKEKGIQKIQTSLKGWQTPFGVVEPEAKIISKLEDSGFAGIEENVLEDEHSVAGMMPYIKYYIPGAKVVPIILRSGVTQEEAQNLANWLAEFYDQDSVFIAPVDFSHYLTASQAQEHDNVTLLVMEKFDYRSLYSFNNGYVDSPPSIALELMIIQKLGKDNLHVLNNTNSGFLENNKFMQTTSYFEIMFD